MTSLLPYISGHQVIILSQDQRLPAGTPPGTFIQQGAQMYVINADGCASLVANDEITVSNASAANASVAADPSVMYSNASIIHALHTRLSESQMEVARLTDLVAELQTEIAALRITG